VRADTALQRASAAGACPIRREELIASLRSALRDLSALAFGLKKSTRRRARLASRVKLTDED